MSLEERTIIDTSSEALKFGQVILYPTDTIWGIGCDCENSAALDRIFDIKKRPKSKPLITLVSSIDMFKSQVKSLHPRIETLLVYHRKPLTLICDAQDHVRSQLKSERDGTMAIRLVQDEFCRQMIDQLGRPISSTSANVSGSEFPSCYADISEAIITQVDYLVRHRLNEAPSDNSPSVIAKFDERGNIIILR